MKEVINGALRFDQGKPELHHIHPTAWKVLINKAAASLPSSVRLMNIAMDQYFYYNRTDWFETAWVSATKDEILEMTKVLEFGAKKYASLNYAKGMKFSRVMNSFRRHTLKLVGGETHDDESGISHIGHILCNFMFMLVYIQEKVGEDDRVLLNKPEIKEKDIGPVA